jgi:hypothetical protein
MTSDKVAKIRYAFQKANKNGDHSEINKFDTKDLYQAKNELIPDRNEPYYQLIIDKLNEKNTKEERRYDFIRGIIVGIIVGIAVLILSQYILRIIFK